tara:strand:- start:970 stop:1446 length:477 start_codon:yes stop_codon:yes gene_type:complete
MAKKVKTTELKVDKSMMLITSNWGPYKSFKAIPVTDACPYMEAIFDPSSKILAVISKHSKQSYHMLPKLDDNGDPMKLKISKRENGKDYREERRLIETYAEYYVSEREEIESFLKGFCLNADSYDYTQYLDVELSNQINAAAPAGDPIMEAANLKVMK